MMQGVSGTPWLMATTYNKWSKDNERQVQCLRL